MTQSKLTEQLHTPITINRRLSQQIMVGNVPVGGGAPISIQSMTNTDTMDIEATVKQIRAMVDAGADIVRVSTPTLASAEAFAEIRNQVDVPLVADIHFDYQIALKVADAGADCLRINPGNIGKKTRIRQVIDKAKEHNIPIRIGVNAGSLEKDLQVKYKEPNASALIESALRQIDIFDQFDFHHFKLSLKASSIKMTVEAYSGIANRIDQPLHIGITEAGSLRSGTVKSAIGLGALLLQGIGDTLRVSLAADPVEEVRVGWDLLKSLQLRQKGVNLIACPSCSRQNFDVIATVNQLEQRLDDIKTPIDVAIIGCYVNGPGESKEVDIGLTGAKNQHLIYRSGKPFARTNSENIVNHIEKLVREQVSQQ